MEESVFLILFLFPFFSLASNQTLGFLPTAASLRGGGSKIKIKRTVSAKSTSREVANLKHHFGVAFALSSSLKYEKWLF